jgi:hypothetical protein
MRIIGCDLHARQQTLAMLDTGTGGVVNRTLSVVVEIKTNGVGCRFGYNAGDP